MEKLIVVVAAAVKEIISVREHGVHFDVIVQRCESWTLRKNEEIRLDAFEMKGLRKILRVS